MSLHDCVSRVSDSGEDRLLITKLIPSSSNNSTGGINIVYAIRELHVNC